MGNVAVLDVRLYGQPIGTLTRLPNDRILFAFTEDYIANGDRPTLSLSFKDTFGSLRPDTRPTQTRLRTAQVLSHQGRHRWIDRTGRWCRRVLDSETSISQVSARSRERVFDDGIG